MALRTPDLIRETSTTTGTGAYTTGGALPGHLAMSDRLTVADTFYYRAIMGTAWEIGLGTYSAANTLQRTTVLLSTNANAAVNWGAGTKIICSVAPEALLDLFFRASGGTMTGNLTIAKAQPQLILDATGVSSAALVMKSDTLNRFNLFTSGAGLNLFWWRYDDAGANIGTIMQVTRATGETGMGGAPQTGTQVIIRTPGLVASETGLALQNQFLAADSEVSLNFQRTNGQMLSRLRGQRIGSTNNGKLIASAYVNGVEVPVAEFNSSGNIVHLPTGNKVDAFPSGTRLLFQQSTVPTGWTKDATLNDRALRVVSGSVSTGGSLAFSAGFTARGISGSVGATVLSWNEMPVHNHTGVTDEQGWHAHTYLDRINAGGGEANVNGPNSGGGDIGRTTDGAGSHAHNLSINNAGANWGHGHTLAINNLDMAITYVDAVVGQKD